LAPVSRIVTRVNLLRQRSRWKATSLISDSAIHGRSTDRQKPDLQKTRPRIHTIFIDGSVRVFRVIAGDLGYTGGGHGRDQRKLAVRTSIIQRDEYTAVFRRRHREINCRDLRARGSVHIPEPRHFAYAALMKVALAKRHKAVTLAGARAAGATISGQADFTIVSEGEKLR